MRVGSRPRVAPEWALPPVPFEPTAHFAPVLLEILRGGVRLAAGTSVSIDDGENVRRAWMDFALHELTVFHEEVNHDWVPWFDGRVCEPYTLFSKGHAGCAGTAS